MAPIKEQSGMPRLWICIQETVFLLGCFFYLLFRVHPMLMLEMKPAVFLKNAGFFNGFLSIPGGLIDWVSAFFSIYWLSDLFAAGFLTLCLLLTVLLTGKWIELLTRNRHFHTLHLIPAALILVSIGTYDFRLSILLGLIANLAVLLAFNVFAPKHQGVRAASAFLLAVLMYWVTGGAFLVFAVLCGLEDILIGKRRVSGLVLLMLSAVLPYAGFITVFLVDLKHAYWHNLLHDGPGRTILIQYGLPAFYLLTLLIVSILKAGRARRFHRIKIPIPGFLKSFAGLALISIGTFLPAEKSCDETTRTALQINRFAKENRWNDVLESAGRFRTLNPLFAFQTNLALFESNLLLEKMFAYPQSLGTRGLLMDYEWFTAWPEEAGGIYWKLGLLNESQHWTTEAYEHKGPTPDLLTRLGLIFMLKGANATAERYFLNLRDVPRRAESAGHLLRLNENPAELAGNTAYRHVRACMPERDFISLGVLTPVELEHLLKRNPANRMALEYLNAYYLLNGELKKIRDHVPDFSAAGYGEVPRHVQEALILYAALTPKFDVNELKKWVHPLVYRRFLEYERVLRRFGGNRADARHDLAAGFRDTYWYYAMFVKSASKRSENQNDFQ